MARGDQPVSLPSVADLAGERRIAAPLLPVDLVGSGARLELAAEEQREPVSEFSDQAVVDETPDQHEAVGVERRPFDGCEHT